MGWDWVYLWYVPSISIIIFAFSYKNKSYFYHKRDYLLIRRIYYSLLFSLIVTIVKFSDIQTIKNYGANKLGVSNEVFIIAIILILGIFFDMFIIAGMYFKKLGNSELSDDFANDTMQTIQTQKFIMNRANSSHEALLEIMNLIEEYTLESFETSKRFEYYNDLKRFIKRYFTNLGESIRIDINEKETFSNQYNNLNLTDIERSELESSISSYKVFTKDEDDSKYIIVPYSSEDFEKDFIVTLILDKYFIEFDQYVIYMIIKTLEKSYIYTYFKFEDLVHE